MSHPCTVGSDGKAFVQLRFADRAEALAVAWSRTDVPFEELLETAHHLGGAHSISRLLLAIRRDDAGRLPEGAEGVDEIPILARIVD